MWGSVTIIRHFGTTALVHGLVWACQTSVGTIGVHCWACDEPLLPLFTPWRQGFQGFLLHNRKRGKPMIRKGLRHKTRLIFAFAVDTFTAVCDTSGVKQPCLTTTKHLARATHDERTKPLLAGIKASVLSLAVRRTIRSRYTLSRG